MKVACIDFEGVLVPEIWVNLAEQSGVQELKLTTRDMSDYDELMAHRVRIMSERGLQFNDIRIAAAALDPLPGAIEFLAWLRRHYLIAIVSDTFHEIAQPLTAKLGDPMILCHRLEIADDDTITGYHMRQDDPKRCAVAAFQSLKYEVVATGDSYNDISMLEQAEHGMLFRPSDKVRADYPEFPVARDYPQLQAMFADAIDHGSD